MHVGSDGKFIAELVIKEDNYILWMLSHAYVNFLEFTDKKNLGHLIQWNLLTH